MDVIEAIEREQMRLDIPDFRAGDTVKVHAKIKEGDRRESRYSRVWWSEEEKGKWGPPSRFARSLMGLGWSEFFPFIHPISTRSKSFPRARSEEDASTTCAN